MTHPLAFAIIIAVWIIGIPAAYFLELRKWDDHSKFEQWWFSVVWPCILILYPIHWIHMHSS